MKVIVTETYVYEIEVDTDIKSKAIAKAKEIYDSVDLFSDDDIVFSADGNSHKKTTFKVEK